MSYIDEMFTKAENKLKAERDKTIENIKSLLNKAKEDALKI